MRGAAWPNLLPLCLLDLDRADRLAEVELSVSEWHLALHERLLLDPALLGQLQIGHEIGLRGGRLAECTDQSIELLPTLIVHVVTRVGLRGMEIGHLIASTRLLSLAMLLLHLLVFKHDTLSEAPRGLSHGLQRDVDVVQPTPVILLQPCEYHMLSISGLSMRLILLLLVLEQYLAELLLFSLPLLVFEMHLATSARRVAVLVLPRSSSRRLQDWLVFAIRGGSVVVEGLHTRRPLLLLLRLMLVIDVIKRMRQCLALHGRS